MKLETKLKKWDLRKWKKEFDTVFSLYIRTRDNFTCFTCGRKGDRNNIDNGHYIPRGACRLALYFHEDNCHAQCTYCNHTLEGNRHVYREKLGEDKHNELYMLNRTSSLKYTKHDYAHLIEVYKKKLQALPEAQNGPVGDL